jgi:hypothetical protein
MKALRGFLLLVALGALVATGSSTPTADPVRTRETIEPEPTESVEEIRETPEDETASLRAEIARANARVDEATLSIDNPGCMWPPSAFQRETFRDPYGTAALEHAQRLRERVERMRREAEDAAEEETPR